MCVIAYLPPKVNIPEGMLQNAVWNNPHGFGLVLKSNTSFEVIREHREENDFKEINELLRKHDDKSRYLHVRWQTKGDISKENVHPFCVFDDGKGREVWFMHNGTLHEYSPKDEKEDARSDSRIFADTILIPLLKATNGDYSSDIIKAAISKFWGFNSNNRGLLTSSFEKPLFVNLSDWKTVKCTSEDGKELIDILSSNDDYWTTLKRGPEFDRREEEKKQKQKASSTFRTNELFKKVDSWPITKLKDINFKPNDPISDDLVTIWEDFDLYSEEGLASLENIAANEMEAACFADPKNAANLLIYMTSEYARLVDEKNAIEEKHTKASKLIAQLKAQLDKRVG